MTEQMYSYEKWQQLGRQVMKGQRAKDRDANGIALFAESQTKALGEAQWPFGNDISSSIISWEEADKLAKEGKRVEGRVLPGGAFISLGTEISHLKGQDWEFRLSQGAQSGLSKAVHDGTLGNSLKTINRPLFNPASIPAKKYADPSAERDAAALREQKVKKPKADRPLCPVQAQPLFWAEQVTAMPNAWGQWK